GTSRSSTLDGRWVKTIVFTRPKRRANGTAARYEPAEHTPVQKKMVPAVATERSNRWKSHSARSDWTTKPRPKGIETEEGGKRIHHAPRLVERRMCLARLLQSW